MDLKRMLIATARETQNVFCKTFQYMKLIKIKEKLKKYIVN